MSSGRVLSLVRGGGGAEGIEDLPPVCVVEGCGRLVGPGEETMAGFTGSGPGRPGGHTLPVRYATAVRAGDGSLPVRLDEADGLPGMPIRRQRPETASPGRR